MPAPETRFNANNLLLKVGAATVGCETSSTLTVAREARGAAGKCSPQWIQTAAAATTWGIEFDSLYLQSSAVLDSDDLALSVGAVDLEGIRSATVEFRAEPFEQVDTTTGLTPLRGVDSRQVVITAELSYFDPESANGAALGTVLDEVLGTTTTAAGLALVLDVGSFQISGNFRPTQAPIASQKPGFAGVSVTFESTGAVAYTATNADSGVAALLSAAFDAAGVQEVTALFTTNVSGAEVPETTKWSGSAIPERLTVTIPYPGEVTVAGTLSGSGALAPAVVPAA